MGLATGTTPAGSGTKSASRTVPVRLLPPPPPPGQLGTGFGGGFGAASAAAATARDAPPGGTNTSGPSSTGDLLQLDSSTEDDGEEEYAGGDKARVGNTRGKGTGVPDSGAAALWDLLDLNLDVMTWLERTEAAQQQLQKPQQFKDHKQQQHVSHQRLRSSSSTAPTPALAIVPTAAAYLNLPAGYPPNEKPPGAAWGDAGTAFGVGSAATGAPIAFRSAAGSAPRLGMAESVILTSEFPVNDLLTPLPTGGGVPHAIVTGPASSGPISITSQAAAAAASAAAQPIPSPPGSFSRAYAQPPPPPHLQPSPPHSAGHSTSLLRIHVGSSPQPLNIGVTSATAAPAATPASSSMAATSSSNSAPGGVMQANVMQSGSLSRPGNRLGMRATAAQSASVVTAAPVPVMDLDNLLALQLNTLDTSLAQGPSGKGAVGGGRPGNNWQPATTVGGVYGGANGSGRR
ncbi:hypothetical protein Vafri_19314 [Volvox africanus]|nr:hypothetical protein Vafri_19314 [Volvox africanus]